jgi:hypothetical protein
LAHWGTTTGDLFDVSNQIPWRWQTIHRHAPQHPKEKLTQRVPDSTHIRVSPQSAHPNGQIARLSLSSPRLPPQGSPRKWLLPPFARLKPALEALGMKAAFSSGAADFSGMDGRDRLFLGDALHKAYVDVNEEGTEAAAATAVEPRESAAVETPVFRADHPFVFMIYEKKNGSILLLGRLASPNGGPISDLHLNRDRVPALRLSRAFQWLHRTAVARIQSAGN